MKKEIKIIFIAFVIFAALASGAHALSYTTLPSESSSYPYQYNEVATYVTFDEKGKAVVISTLGAETLSNEAVDEITLRIPYSGVSVWYAKEQVEKRELIVSLWRDYVYPRPVYESDVAFPKQTEKIQSDVFYRSDFFDANLDVKTETRGDSTYLKIKLRGALYSKEARNKIEELNTKDAKSKLDSLIQKFNNTTKDKDEIKHSSYEAAGKIIVKYSVPRAIKVAEKEGKLEFKTLTDVNAPIEILTVGVNAPYGYKFEAKPDFPLATQAEIRNTALSAPLMGGSAPAKSYSVAAGAVSSPMAAERASASISTLSKIAYDESIAYPEPYPYPKPQPQFDYIEVRSNIDADEVVTIKGKYKIIKEPEHLSPDLMKYLPYIIGAGIILAAAAVAQRYKLLWD